MTYLDSSEMTDKGDGAIVRLGPVMSLRPRSDFNKPPPSQLWVHAQTRTNRPAVKTVAGYMFNDHRLDTSDLKELRENGGRSIAEHRMLRRCSAGLWDTLTPDVVSMMMNPPLEYDATYQRKINIAFLTAIAAVNNTAESVETGEVAVYRGLGSFS